MTELERVAKSKKTIIRTRVSRLKVIAGAKEFDGDELSQNRMMRAIVIAGITGETTTMWKLVNNTVVQVTLTELQEALTKAGKAMSELWLAED